MNKKAEYKNTIYKEAKDRSAEQDLDNYMHASGIGAVGNIGSIGVATLGTKLQPKLSDEEVRDIVRSKSEEIGFDKDVIEIEKAKNNMQAYAAHSKTGRPRVNVGNNEFVLRHELGHVDDYSKRHAKQYYKNTDKKHTYEGYINMKLERDKGLEKLRGLFDELDETTDRDSFNRIHDKIKQCMDDVEGMEDYIEKYSPRDTEHLDKLKKISGRTARGAVSSLHSKTLRDAIREKNNGKSKIVDKSMDVLDNPYASTAILGAINGSPQLRGEFIASADATKNMIKRHGAKKGIMMSAPIFAGQFGSYVGNAVLMEGMRGTAIRSGETVAKKVVKNRKNKEKK